jgi:hypothetical protein
MPTRYTVRDGKRVLNLEAAAEGGYVVTSPLDPELITEAETLEEAFANARDAAPVPPAGTGEANALVVIIRAPEMRNPR